MTIRFIIKIWFVRKLSLWILAKNYENFYLFSSIKFKIPTAWGLRIICLNFRVLKITDYLLSTRQCPALGPPRSSFKISKAKFIHVWPHLGVIALFWGTIICQKFVTFFDFGAAYVYGNGSEKVQMGDKCYWIDK